MLFEFNSDQRLWRDTVRDVVAKECSLERVRQVVDGAVDPDALWRVYVDLGWTELTDTADSVELAIVVEELGRAADPTPYLATMTQFAPFAPGVAEPGQSGTALLGGVSARRDRDGWVLDGTARYVLDGDRASHLAIVTKAGIFPVSAAQVAAKRVQAFDPVLHVADVSVSDLRLGESDRIEVEVEPARHIALTGMALTMVGACQRVLDLVLDHVCTRHQFDAPVGSFQAVKHKVADMHVAIERARALGYFAALTISANDPRRRLAAAMAKAAAGECQDLVFRNGLQMFGAMGFTWENDLQFPLKRAKAGELLLGDASEHRAQIAEECHAVEL